MELKNQNLNNNLFNCSQIINRISDYMVRKSLGDGYPPVAALAKETSLMFVNQHYSLSGSKPLSPAVIELGGIHIKEEAKPIKEVMSLKRKLN